MGDSEKVTGLYDFKHFKTYYVDLDSTAVDLHLRSKGNYSVKFKDLRI